MPELDSITIKGFKSIADLSVGLGRINIVIGANGSGKSNFLDAFAFLREIRDGRLQEHVARAGGAESVLHFGSKTTKDMRLEVSFGGNTNAYAIDLVPDARESLIVDNEVVSFWNRHDYPDGPLVKQIGLQRKEAAIADENPRSGAVARHVRECLDSWRLYHFQDTSTTSSMRKTGDVEDNRNLRADASNLAPMLHYLGKKHPGSYSLIRNAIRGVAPFFDDFSLEPSNLNPEKIRLEWRHESSDAYFNASSLSDGTLRFIALATLFLQPEDMRPSVILIDEPELGLHPYAIAMLASMIKQAAASTQVIVSTQSSLLLDHFEPEDILVAEREDGGTTLTRPDTARLEKWLEDYSLGQLWEKNELGGRPGGK